VNQRVQAISIGSTGCQPVVRGSLPRTLSRNRLVVAQKIAAAATARC